jgi:hypothetical protein
MTLVFTSSKKSEVCVYTLPSTLDTNLINMVQYLTWDILCDILILIHIQGKSISKFTIY